MTQEPQVDKKSYPVLEQVLEHGPTLAFVVIFFWVKDETIAFAGREYSGLVFATVAFIPVLLIAMGLLWYLTGKLSRMQIFIAVTVIVFGGATAVLNDERFIKIKTTIVYSLFASILGFGLLRGRSYLAYVLSESLPLTQEGWMILTRRLTIMFVVLAALNEVIWRTMPDEIWVPVESFGFPILLFVFLMAQFATLQRHMELDEQD